MPPSYLPVSFHYDDQHFYFPQRNQFKQFLLSILSNHQRKVESIRIIFCSDARLLAINQQFLKHNTYTDIITFELSSSTQPLVAEMYISIDRVRDNARRYSVQFLQELQRVMIHGVLHLCGYKDKTTKEANQIRSMEDHYLNLFVPRGTKKV